MMEECSPLVTAVHLSNVHCNIQPKWKSFNWFFVSMKWEWCLQRLDLIEHAVCHRRVHWSVHVETIIFTCGTYDRRNLWSPIRCDSWKRSKGENDCQCKSDEQCVSESVDVCFHWLLIRNGFSSVPIVAMSILSISIHLRFHPTKSCGIMRSECKCRSFMLCIQFFLLAPGVKVLIQAWWLICVKIPMIRRE